MLTHLNLTLLIGLLTLLPHQSNSNPPQTANDLYSQIQDLKHPTVKDYRQLQNFLSHSPRDELKKLNDYNYEHVARNFKIIGSLPNETPKSGMVAVNCSKEEKENCVLLYASFNRNYPNGLRRLRYLIKRSDFKGHILYRIGGWPNAADGGLQLAHVPYAFKACFFKEAERLGYKRVFWLDTAIIPIESLNTLFEAIREKGYFVMGNSHMVGPFMNQAAAEAFGLTLEETYHIPSCSAGIFAVDFTHPKGKAIIDRWYEAAFDKNAYYSARVEQNALSIILYQLGIQDFVPIEQLPHSPREIRPDSLLLLDRSFAHWGR